MGGDGGSIPRRIELVKTKQKDEQLQRDFEVGARWNLCALSQQPLREPIVACELGRLYNKEALIEALLNKTIAGNANASHIRSLKDVKELNLTPNPAYDAKVVDKGAEYKDFNVAQFICPVVGLEMNGKYRFCFIWRCGCVVSEKALKEVESEVCHKCGQKFNAIDDVIALNGTDEDIVAYTERMNAKREAQKQAKKDKKVKTEEPLAASSSKDKVAQKRKSAEAGAAGDSSGPNLPTKKPHTIQEDPNASKVYKSLFTTSDAAKNQPKAHWVTYNPLYN